MPYRNSRYFSYRSLNRYRNMLVSYRFKYRTVPDYTGCTGENRTFRPKIETRTVPKKKKNYINHLHCHLQVTNPLPVAAATASSSPLSQHKSRFFFTLSQHKFSLFSVYFSCFVRLWWSNKCEWMTFKWAKSKNWSLLFQILSFYDITRLCTFLLLYYHFIKRMETLMWCSKLVVIRVLL